MSDLEDLGLKAFSYTAKTLISSGYSIKRRLDDEYLIIQKDDWCAIGSHDEDILGLAFEHYERSVK